MAGALILRGANVSVQIETEDIWMNTYIWKTWRRVLLLVVSLNIVRFNLSLFLSSCLRIHIFLHMWEICKQLSGLNPRINSCFADEDFIRILCSIVAGLDWLSKPFFSGHQGVNFSFFGIRLLDAITAARPNNV